MAIQYYLGLVTSQHQGKPKYTALLTKILEKVDFDDLLNSFNNLFNINQAVGAQQDILGEIVGRSRELNFTPEDHSSSITDDVTYQMILKAKIVLNQWDGSLNKLTELWNNTFPDMPLIIIDNQDMTVDIILSGSFSVFQQQLISNGYILPKSFGVSINYYFAKFPIFAYDMENEYFRGYDDGGWINNGAASLVLFGYDLDTDTIKGYDQGYWDYF